VIPIADIDVFYISYDEPKCEEYWANLKAKCPWAKRVHGVTGFDEAHKACAMEAGTTQFITIDGDNIVEALFFDESVVRETERNVWSWSGKNVVNDLTYGNGGIKCWPRNYVLEMKTHENADSDSKKVDFCWDANYLHRKKSYSLTCPNGSPFQAFRAGFREGVKLTLDRGVPVPLNRWPELRKVNLERLKIWCSVGADIENGLWCMYGARMGIFKSNLEDWDFSLISNYDWFDRWWEYDIKPLFEGEGHYCRYTGYSWNEDNLWYRLYRLGDEIRHKTGLEIADLDEAGSRFFKKHRIAR